MRGPQQIISLKQSGAKILLIAPGEQEMPVNGWGAVESLVWAQSVELNKIGFNVLVMNSWNPVMWFRALAWRPNLVICHYDVFSKMSKLLSKASGAPLITISHFGYAAFPEKWNTETAAVMSETSKGDVVVFLNESIRSIWTSLFRLSKTAVVPNFVSTSEFAFKPTPSRKYVCLGKIEPRKRQVELAQACSEELDITFAGAPVDPRIELIDPIRREKFVGPVDREWVVSNLTDFEALVLASDGEADALVLYEAQAAGLQIIATPQAYGAQDVSLPWIHVLELEEIPAFLEALPPPSPQQRLDIRKHAERFYSKELWLRSWTSAIDESLGLSRRVAHPEATEAR